MNPSNIINEKVYEDGWMEDLLLFHAKATKKSVRRQQEHSFTFVKLRDGASYN